MFLGGKFGKSNRTFPFIRFFSTFDDSLRFSVLTDRLIWFANKSNDDLLLQLLDTLLRQREKLTESSLFSSCDDAREIQVSKHVLDGKWNNCTAIPNKNYPNRQSLRDMISHDDFLFHRKLFISVYTHNRFDSKKKIVIIIKRRNRKRKKNFFPAISKTL